MKLTSYWLDTSARFDQGATRPLEGRYDVAVVGGGLTGASAALALARKGARVALLEADTIGNAASGRNGGMCNNGFAQNYAVMSGKYGKDVADRLYKTFDAGVDLVERLAPQLRLGIDLDQQAGQRAACQGRGRLQRLELAGAEVGVHLDHAAAGTSDALLCGGFIAAMCIARPRARSASPPLTSTSTPILPPCT
mgnify:CR=1 FL=1